MKQKQTQFLKSLLYFGAGLLTVLVIGALLGAWECDWMAGSGGAVMAFAAGATAEQTVQGTVTTTDSDGVMHDVNTPDISKKIAKIGHSQAPLDTILREADSLPAAGFEYKYYSVADRGIGDKITDAFTASGTGVKQIKVQNVHIWSPHTLVLVPNITVDADGNVSDAPNGAMAPLVMFITEISQVNKTLTVMPSNTASIPNLAAGTVLARMGAAKDERAAISLDPISMPFDDENYCQIHMTTVSEGLYQKLQKKDVDWGLMDMQEQAILDFRMTNEATSLFGVKRKLITPDRKTIYTSDGIIRKINKQFDMGAKSAIDNDLLLGWIGDIFCGNNGSDTRFLFYGKEFGRKLAAAQTISKQLDAGKTEVVFGIEFNRIVTNFGTLLLRHHDLFNSYGYSKAGMVLDKSCISRAICKPLELTPLNLDASGISRSKDVRIDEAHCVITSNPETHAMLYCN